MRLPVSGSIVCAVALLLPRITALPAQDDLAQLEEKTTELLKDPWH